MVAKIPLRPVLLGMAGSGALILMVLALTQFALMSN